MAASIAAPTSAASRMPLSRLGSSPKTMREGLVLPCHNHVRLMTTDHRSRPISPFPQSGHMAQSVAAQRIKAAPPRPSPPRLRCGRPPLRHPDLTRPCLWSRLRAVCCDDIPRRTFVSTTVGDPNHHLSRPGLRPAIYHPRRATLGPTTASENHFLSTPSRHLTHTTLTRGHLVHHPPKRRPSRMVRRSNN